VQRPSTASATAWPRFNFGLPDVLVTLIGARRNGSNQGSTAFAQLGALSGRPLVSRASPRSPPPHWAVFLAAPLGHLYVLIEVFADSPISSNIRSSLADVPSGRSQSRSGRPGYWSVVWPPASGRLSLDIFWSVSDVAFALLPLFQVGRQSGGGHASACRMTIPVWFRFGRVLRVGRRSRDQDRKGDGRLPAAGITNFRSEASLNAAVNTMHEEGGMREEVGHAISLRRADYAAPAQFHRV